MIMGCDYYESDSQRRALREAGAVPMGIGAGCTLRNVIVDKNARIGDNVQIINK
jgi:glucose-1-phosphate adenylyltransferase